MKELLKKHLLFSAVLPLLLGAWVPEKKAVIHQGAVSRSMWIWTADKPVKDNSIACFRLKFDLNAPVKKGVIKVNYDDGGRLYLNGKLRSGKNIHSGTTVYDLTRYLKRGTNTIAVQVINARSAAGVLIFGEIKLQNGKTVFLHSNADTKSISGPLKGNWFAANYNDSAWGKSRVFGDILVAPWSRYRDLTNDFFTPEEKRIYRKKIADSIKLPRGIASEKFTPASIASRNGMFWFKFGNDYHWPIIYMKSGGNFRNDTEILRYRAMGQKVFEVYQSEETYRRDDGSLNFDRLDKSVRRTLNLIPDGKIFVKLWVHRTPDLCKKYPEETMKFGTGPADSIDERLGRPLRPSPASQKFRQETTRVIRELSEFIHKQPWGKRVMGIRVCYGIYSEWHSYGMYQAPDLSKPMTAEFRRFLKAKYKTVKALRKAWKNSQVTFETAQVPTAKERWGKIRFFRNPATEAKELDFYEAYAHTHADLLIHMAKAVKKYFPGRLCGAYYGYVLGNHPPEGSNVLLDKVAASPYVDFLSCPPPYTPEARFAGGDYLSRVTVSTLAKYGKLLIIEDDSRFHHIPGFTSKSITTRSALESRMTMRRNMLNTLFEKCGTQLTDANSGHGLRPGVFDDPSVRTAYKESLAVMKKALPLPADSGNEIAVVWNYMERLRHSNVPALKSQVIQGTIVNSLTLPKLYRSGFTFDLMSMTDFMTAKKKYKVIIFLNAFTLSAAERNALKAKVRKPGMTAVFLHGAGYVTPKGFSAAAVSDLTGMKIGVDAQGRKSFLKFANSGIPATFGKGTAERFFVTDPQAKSFGFYLKDKKVGAAVKKLSGGAQTIYAAHYPTSPAQWREILLKTGVKPLVKPGSYIRRRGNLYMFHTGTKGKHLITFPGKVKGATELFSGTKSSGNSVTVTSDAGPDTWVFKTF